MYEIGPIFQGTSDAYSFTNWERVAADLFQLNNSTCLLVVDYSRYPEVKFYYIKSCDL